MKELKTENFMNIKNLLVILVFESRWRLARVLHVLIQEKDELELFENVRIFYIRSIIREWIVHKSALNKSFVTGNKSYVVCSGA